MLNIFRNTGIRLLFLLLGILPSFTNFFIQYFDSSLFVGTTISSWYIIYIFITYSLILIFSGKKTLTIGLVTSVISAGSVVFVGSLILYVKSGFSNELVYEYSPHYLKILLTTIAVVPISLAFILSIPTHSFETKVLNQYKGVSKLDKFLLMATRIFNHITYNVLPKIFEVKKEETNNLNLALESIIDDSVLDKSKNTIKKIKSKILEYTHLLLTIVVESIELIPLWAIEISQLPSNKTLKYERTKQR